MEWCDSSDRFPCNVLNMSWINDHQISNNLSRIHILITNSGNFVDNYELIILLEKTIWRDRQITRSKIWKHSKCGFKRSRFWIPKAHETRLDSFVDNNAILEKIWEMNEKFCIVFDMLSCQKCSKSKRYEISSILLTSNLQWILRRIAHGLTTRWHLFLLWTHKAKS